MSRLLVSSIRQTLRPIIGGGRGGRQIIVCPKHMSSSSSSAATTTSASRLLNELQSVAYIDGQWRRATTDSGGGGKTFPVYNPAVIDGGQSIGQAYNSDLLDTGDAIAAAGRAFGSWSRTTAKYRSSILRRLFDLQMKRQDELASLLTLECGKPLRESIGEIGYGGSFFEWFAEEAKRLDGCLMQSPWPDKRVMYTKEPAGVVAIITPWNFPNAMITRKLGAVLAAGCTAVIRPAEDTPFSGLAIAKLAEEAGVPAGVVNVIPSDRTNAGPIGKLLCESPEVSVVSFTGSTAVGKQLLAMSASTVKRVCLELGGNAPFIVFDSADVDKAVDGCMISKFRNAGQTCVCANRIFVQKGIHDKFVQRLAEKMAKELIVGDGRDNRTTLGPLINERGVDKVRHHLSDAVGKGANIYCGGKHIGGNFFEPTIVTNVTRDMLFTNEETFGPLAPIYRFSTEEEVISLANDSQGGLAGYFYSQDSAQIWRVSRSLKVGMIGINEGLISSCEVPFGGVKQSGIGREGSHFGCDEFLDVKYMCWGGL
ncbi:succinate-semialdehyde dehydrogenase, mitochondrial-like [Oppia nitens]|uniref:succinate-semialdehyde dehydrogenase, mitochondrial-like n=1 Tax=Oppia nitens TaxID=1686743 RepID=UPI0023DCE7D3|nr:succinate-semialdehyde dehydrogenase, mitochondrial-like [Oppia nitens]